MKIAQLLESSKEMIFLDSTSSCEASSSSLTVLLTVTKAGAIPIAVLIHANLTKSNYVDAMDLLKKNFPFCLGGKEYPEIFMSDDSSALKGALKIMWPKSRQLLCHFHVAQAEWRWIFSQSNIVKEDKQRLMKLFQSVMYANEENILATAFKDVVNEVFKYPAFVQRFLSFYERKVEWLLLERKSLITRQNNTNNFAEATIRILKDVVLNRTKAFNVVALCDFCINIWETYLIKKLLEFAHSRRREINVLYENITKRASVISDSDVSETESNIFVIKSKTKDLYYTVNTDIGTCTCPSGESGAFCKHQCFLLKNKKLSLPNSPPVTPEEKYCLAVLAVGKNCPAPSFFSNFTDDTEINIQLPFVNNNIQDSTVNPTPANPQNLPSTQQIQEVKDELNRITHLIDSSECSSDSVTNFLNVLKKIKCEDDLKSLILMSSLRVRSKRINVQPTGIARRRSGITKSSKRIPPGRPKVDKKKKLLKRRRNLSQNVNVNLPNAKSH